MSAGCRPPYHVFIVDNAESLDAVETVRCACGDARVAIGADPEVDEETREQSTAQNIMGMLKPEEIRESLSDIAPQPNRAQRRRLYGPNGQAV